MPDPTPLTPEEDALWRALGRLVHVLPRLLDEDMLRGTGLSMTEYAVLRCLAEAPAQRLRMTELAALTAFSPSRMTRVVDGLATRGLVGKERCPDDARGAVAVLTAPGADRLRDADDRHVLSARKRVLDHVGPAELPVVREVLARLAACATTAGPPGDGVVGAEPGAVAAAEAGTG